MCRMGTSRLGKRQCSVEVEPARQPTNSTTSAAATTSRVAITPPLEPTTPAFRGWVSARLPCPLTVTQTAALSDSASSCKAPLAPAMTTPPPQMITGARALTSRCAARATSRGSGA
ncbi:hypothetical protein LMG3410_05772 [Achromobacter aegrifaciens]|nr:hypothetical protein LMG3410_05772 [Achromobacter aegrifaciens]